MAPGLSVRICRPVQSSSCRYSLNGIGSSPLFVAPFGEYVPPAAGHVVIRPASHDIGAIADDDVNVIAHDRKTENIDGEIPGQKFQAALNPFLAVVEAFSRDNIGAAQKGAPHAAIDAVIDADFGRIEHEHSGNARH